MATGRVDGRLRVGPVSAGGGSVTTETGEGSLRIGQLAARLGINPKTIRYYESIGLLPAPERRPSGYRMYGAPDLERVAFIRRAQRFGLRLDEIGEILALRDRGQRPCDYVLGAVRRELADLDRRVAELNASREQLAALVRRADRLPAAEARFCDLLEHRESQDH
jgi:DNA-binding transcriptional MerR regulator